MDIITDSSCSRSMTQICPRQQLWPRHHHGPGGNIGHPGQYGPGDSMTLGCQLGLRWLSRYWVSTQPLVATGTTDINPDPDCCWAMDPGMTHSSSLAPDDTMTPCGSTGPPDGFGPGGSIALRHQHGHRLWPRPQTSMLVSEPQTSKQNPAVIGPQT